MDTVLSVPRRSRSETGDSPWIMTIPAVLVLGLAESVFGAFCAFDAIILWDGMRPTHKP